MKKFSKYTFNVCKKMGKLNMNELNNRQLKAGGLELWTKSPDTGPRPVELSHQF